MNIQVNDLIYSSHHGVFRKEKENAQRFLTNVSLTLWEKPAGDSIDDTRDYFFVKDVVREVIEDESHNLLETIVEVITSRILADARVKSTEVSVTKLDVWDNGAPTVSVRHGKKTRG